MSNKLVNAIGIISVFAAVAYLIKKINKETETKLISEEAFDALQDRNNIKELNNIVSKYHKTGEWDNSKLQNIH